MKMYLAILAVVSTVVPWCRDVVAHGVAWCTFTCSRVVVMRGGDAV